MSKTENQTKYTDEPCRDRHWGRGGRAGWGAQTKLLQS